MSLRLAFLVVGLHWLGMQADHAPSTPPTTLYDFPFSARTTICPNRCSSHGVCAYNATLTCECFPGWTGLDCSLRVCPSSAAWVAMPTDYNSAHPEFTECSNMVRTEMERWRGGGMEGWRDGGTERWRSCSGQWAVCSGHYAVTRAHYLPFCSLADYDVHSIESYTLPLMYPLHPHTHTHTHTPTHTHPHTHTNTHTHTHTQGACDRTTGQCQCRSGFDGPACDTSKLQ
jgi:hypothetical protein